MISVSEIKRCCKIEEISISSTNQEYDYADILGPPKIKYARSIFFATKSHESEWYSETFDRNILIKKLAKIRPEWLYITDDKNIRKKGIKNFVIVESVEETLNRIVEIIQKKNTTKVIAVTGSVGKTTVVQLLGYNIIGAQVINAKRLTPLLIWDFYINQLKKDTLYIIAEVGLYYKGQVKWLNGLLKPYISIITNIYDMHLHWNGISNRNELLKEKCNILNNAVWKIIPSRLYYEYQKIFEAYKDICFLNNDQQILNIGNEVYFNSEVFFEQMSILYKVVNICNQDKNLNIKELNKECFSLKKTTMAKSIAFIDQHCSIAGYFQALSSHNYNNICLAIISFNFANEDIAFNIGKIVETFNRYNIIVVNIIYKNYFNDYEVKKILFEGINTIKETISKYQYVIIHDPKALLTRIKNV